MKPINPPAPVGSLSNRRLSFGWWVSLSIVLLGLGVMAVPQQLDTRLWSRQEIWGVDRPLVRHTLSRAIDENRYPRKITIRRGNTNYPATVEYTLDPALQDAVKAVFEQYGPDYGVFVALDPDNGEILALVNHRRDGDHSENLALKATYPAASVFKIVTAAAAIDLGKADATTVIPFNGKSTSLYRKNVLSHKNNQWTRRIPLSSAFAKSVNTIFARLGVFSIGAHSLTDYAEAFGFNRDLGADFTLASSSLELDSADPWSVAETAAGYTQNTTLSPVHGAIIASTVINKGQRIRPTLIRKIVGDDGLILYEADTTPSEQTIHSDSAGQLQVLMRQTIEAGSARTSFKKFASGTMVKVDVGGKTGSLSGRAPTGRYDWFVGYAEKNGRKLAFATMCINRDFWYVKSAFVARKAIEHFFRDNG